MLMMYERANEFVEDQFRSDALSVVIVAQMRKEIPPGAGGLAKVARYWTGMRNGSVTLCTL
jgi:hypothetical protein